MILTGVHRNPDLMITQAYREISPASGRIWALAALTEAYFDKYEVWKWTEVHVNDPMLVETFSSGRKCKIAVGATLQDTFREYSERLRKYSVNRCFRRNMIRFFFNRKCGNLGKNLPLWHRKKKTGSIASLVCTYDFIVGVSQWVRNRSTYSQQRLSKKYSVSMN